MALLNTLILPTDSEQVACELLEDLIFRQPHLVMVAFGTTPDISELVELADAAVGNQRHALALAWARDRSKVRQVIDKLKASPEALLNDVADCRAITLSRSDVIKDVITAREAMPDMTRVFLAFSNGASL